MPLTTTIPRSAAMHVLLLRLLVLSLAVQLSGQVSVDDTHATRFDPPFQNDLHAPRTEDAGIVEILGRHGIKAVGESQVLLVHGRFLDSRHEAVIALTFLSVQNGYSPATFLFAKDNGGWNLRVRNDLLNPAYCRVISTSAGNDLLLCQTNFVGRKGVVETNLYTLDFTRNPPDSGFFLQLKDTVGLGSPCHTWANLKSVGFTRGVLHLVVEYGRSRLPEAVRLQREVRNRAVKMEGSTPAFPRQLYDLEFKLGPAGFSTLGSSEKSFHYVTELWDAAPGSGCSQEP